MCLQSWSFSLVVLRDRPGVLDRFDSAENYWILASNVFTNSNRIKIIPKCVGRFATVPFLAAGLVSCSSRSATHIVYTKTITKVATQTDRSCRSIIRTRFTRPNRSSAAHNRQYTQAISVALQDQWRRYSATQLASPRSLRSLSLRPNGRLHRSLGTPAA